MDKSKDSEYIKAVPSKRQLRYIEGGFYGFVHFTVNTFTDREWGDGSECESLFNPTELNAVQWAKTAKEAGMAGLILTCKHHDGFCLWPSAFTEHTVAHSPYKNGKGDIVRELSDACRENGLRFGVYLSPWDRNCKFYGEGEAYDDYYVNQLTELLTNYGDIMAVWLDGACGEGANGKKQQYDWDRYFETVRRLMPDAVISICGPDIRWCGNEGGYTRPSEWSVVPAYLKDAEKTSANSQTSVSDAKRLKLKSTDDDLGSREVLSKVDEFIYYPSEVDVSIRPGWFYHSYEDDKVRSVDNLWDIYCKSVGGNCTLLLNIPPDRRGLFAEPDVKALKELGARIKNKFADNKAESFVKTDNCTYVSTVRKYNEFRYVILKEEIAKSQRVESFELYANDVPVYRGTTIGAKRIVELEGNICCDKLTLHITDCRKEACMLPVEVY